MTRYLLAAVAALSLASCTEPCVKLAETICACQHPNSQSARDDCERKASDRSSQIGPSSADEDRCDALLGKCDELIKDNCAALETPEGKVACGLANDPETAQ